MDEKGLSQRMLNWIPTGRRKRGRPKTTWNSVLRAMEECGLRDGDREDKLRLRLGVKRHCHTS
jgi:hypothetical protein